MIRQGARFHADRHRWAEQEVTKRCVDISGPIGVRELISLIEKSFASDARIFSCAIEENSRKKGSEQEFKTRNKDLKREDLLSTEFSDRIAQAFATDAQFAELLKDSFAKIGFNIGALGFRAAKSVNLPKTAISLWQDRNKDKKTNPAQFIREVYGLWIGKGLSRDFIREVDYRLYVAYSQWVRPERHPEDAIPFAPSRLHGRIDDPVEAIERRRSSSRKSSALARSRLNNPKASLDLF